MKSKINCHLKTKASVASYLNHYVDMMKTLCFSLIKIYLFLNYRK
ncbi:hypothetical protein HMPREF9444_01925 [Succinatimonas hippei YIT 12066]|uniref:Uncharacterized protein n=1 Tax=Succinatimonas hippei (strain DSM 22608 / JCM 16073 / KCTC 15190 / YIT 12066) TaxID=762983 RepID=E8LMD7_SUCHY|nr:hypothetical protein HMPREF9444_01925 [Succinatimonas hippei YIT 12066]